MADYAHIIFRRILSSKSRSQETRMTPFRMKRINGNF